MTSMIHKDKVIDKTYQKDAEIVVFHGSCLDFMKTIPDGSVKLVVTSPPYNLDKEYEKHLDLDVYIKNQTSTIEECHRILHQEGSICWQVGNYVDKGEIVPIDTILYPVFKSLNMKMRNRIIWHFEHGLHCSKRFSGRYESIVWFTKSDKYTFNLDPVRVPQKYPGKKYFKGPKAGQYSCNPLGKNPGDYWDIPNVKNNHVEKTDYPCQFPVELIERLVLSMTNEDDTVFDPFLGTGTSIIAAIRHGRRGLGSEIMAKYISLSHERVRKEIDGTLKTRPMDKPIYDPKTSGIKLLESPWEKEQTLFDVISDRESFMKIAEIYSHLNGLEFLLVHKKGLWEEVKKVIESVNAEVCKTKISKEKTMKGKLLYSPIDMNHQFKELLEKRQWEESRVSYWVTKNANLIRKTYTLDRNEQKAEIEKSRRGSYY